jgi:hypothetical protein
VNHRVPIHVRRRVATHAAAGLATLILACPLTYALWRADKSISPVLIAAVLGLIYVVLFMVYRTLPLAASIGSADAPGNDWALVVSAVAGATTGIVWIAWVWGMRRPLASLETYAPLLLGTVFLWATLAAGAAVQRRLMRAETRRVPI